MLKIHCFAVLVLASFSVRSQILRNVVLVDFRTYFVQVCSEVFKTLEVQHFHSLKLSSLTQEINDTYKGHRVEGSALYSNSFVVSIQGVDVMREQGLQERWVSPNATSASVSVEGVMRLSNVKMGFDVDTELNGQKRRYTGTMEFPMLHFNFVILKNLFTDEVTTTVTTVAQVAPSRMSMLPQDNITDILSLEFVRTSFNTRVQAWGPEVFQPIAREVVERIPFPRICYNCPISPN